MPVPPDVGFEDAVEDAKPSRGGERQDRTQSKRAVRRQGLANESGAGSSDRIRSVFGQAAIKQAKCIPPVLQQSNRFRRRRCFAHLLAKGINKGLDLTQTKLYYAIRGSVFTNRGLRDRNALPAAGDVMAVDETLLYPYLSKIERRGPLSEVARAAFLKLPIEYETYDIYHDIFKEGSRPTRACLIIEALPVAIKH